MIYGWEKAARKALEKKTHLIDGKYMIVGVAVANVETIEAAFWDYTGGRCDIERADLLLDIKGDVVRHHKAAARPIKHIFTEHNDE
jgi:hypothetical protein